MEAVTLKVTSAFLVGGKVARTGELVEVTMTEAKDLLARGKATLAIDKPAVAIHFTGEVHVPSGSASFDEEPAAEPVEEVTAEPAKPKRSKKAK